MSLRATRRVGAVMRCFLAPRAVVEIHAVVGVAVVEAHSKVVGVGQVRARAL